MSDYTICGFCCERVLCSMIDNHGCDIIKSLKKKFDKTLMAFQREAEMHISKFNQRFDAIERYQSENKLDLADKLNHFVRKDVSYDHAERLAKAEMLLQEILAPKIKVPQFHLLPPIAELNRIANEEIKKRSEHPSRQHLEKKLAEKNKRVAELEKLLGERNSECQNALNEMYKMRHRVNSLVDCLDRKQNEINHLLSAKEGRINRVPMTGCYV